MSRTTLLVLAGLVLVLALAAWRQLAGERRELREAEVPLFEGVDPARVVRIRVEHLGRGLHVVFERDAGGRWSIVEPHSAPADQQLVEHLFQTALERRGTPVAGSAADLGLDPPRVALEMEESVDGGTRRTRVDLGAIDLDGAHMSVRAGGRFLRTWRDLDTTLDRGIEGWMERLVIDLPFQEIVEVHRRGRVTRAGDSEPRDVSFDALLEEGSWRLTSPYEAALDPQGASLFVQGVTLLKVDAYVDYGRRLLADFGLDPPELSIALGTVSSRTLTVRFGRPEHAPGGRWHATIEGRPFVWTVPERPVELFAAPIEEFLDHALTRIPVAQADAVSLELDGRELRLWLERPASPGKPYWMVSERPDRSSAFTPGTKSDPGKVQDLLGAIARAEIASFRPGETLADAEVRGSITVQAGDLRQTVVVGALAEGAEGGRALRVRRSGDSIAGLADPALLELLATPAASLRHLVVVELVEVEQSELRLTRAGASKRWTRGSKGIWTLPDVEIEARELHAVLDGLMIVRATRHLAPGEVLPLADPIEVEVTATEGAKTKYVVGTAGGEAQVEVDGRRSVLADQDLHARLVRVLSGG